MMQTRMAVIAALGVILAPAARAEVTLDPGAIPGVQRFAHVRAAASADQTVMAWLSAEPFGGGQVFVACAANGADWSAPVQVSGNYPEWVLSDGGAGEFALAQASDGSYVVAWSAMTGWRAAVGTAHGSADRALTYAVVSADIWFSRSADGRTWSAPQPVALAPTPDRSPGIIEMPDGRMGVIWVSQREGNPDLSLALADSSGTWGEAVQLTTDPGRDEQYEMVHVGPRFVTDREGRLTLAWVSDRSGAPQVWTAVSGDGRTWSQPVRVSSGPGDKGFVTIEQDGETYNLYWSAQTGEGEQRWMAQSRDFVGWGEPQLAPLGK